MTTFLDKIVYCTNLAIETTVFPIMNLFNVVGFDIKLNLYGAMAVWFAAGISIIWLLFEGMRHLKNKKNFSL
ncbi:MAG: hypothetical protein HRU43_00430 [Simkaniaceae bacterium]|nr:hypothetical protein [Legionellales bacterium]NRA89601.1 hypothetical protein [Simkaniaceae bacterium]